MKDLYFIHRNNIFFEQRSDKVRSVPKEDYFGSCVKDRPGKKSGSKEISKETITNIPGKSNEGLNEDGGLMGR